MGSYDQIAQWYDESVRANSLIHDLVVPVLFELLGDVCGLRVCDLACGQGIVARRLAQTGATVIGVDIAAKLLEIAQREESFAPHGIKYIHDDAQTLATIEDTTFDGVVCNMALMDISDIEAVFRSVQRVLHLNGRFVFSITHPCFLTPASRWLEREDGTRSRIVDSYFDEIFWYSDNAVGVRGQVGAHHRMLSTYVNGLVAAGLMLERMVEPRVIGKMAEQLPSYGEVPIAVVLLCKKV